MSSPIDHLAGDDEIFFDLHVRILAGEESAYAEFEAKLRPRVLGMLARKQAPEPDAEEAWNDAFLEALRRASELEPIGVGLRQFALSVAHRRGVDAIRRLASRGELALLDTDVDASREAASAFAPEVGARIEDCLGRAPGVYATVMEMTSRGLSAAEIALVVDKSEANVAKTRSRARQWLAECLEGVLDGR